MSLWVFARHPNIKFLVAHSGGAFPYLARRIGKQHIDETIKKNNEGKSLRQLLQTANIFFDTSISSQFQYSLLPDIDLPKDHLIYATDYPYMYRRDTGTYLDGYAAPKESGVLTPQELDIDMVRENALRYLFPRLTE
ncbi:hypothetical protein OIDMADRAFT_51462 [Oidiodendron maius Zn]|uniref:Uncharacterized protein n=1 Tax=Oidiodendron maius (strain Zn) TaxID=913774 RepID=A0A0C3HMD5_OIDMZ|nr:hypothetical protein OIDMADRAFT_51462 [Oidiodendron maius Zn]